MKIITTLKIAFLILAMVSHPSWAHPLMPIVFPNDAGVIDVTKAPYFATPNDDTDDTAAIQAALNRYPSGNRIIYLPSGEYLISDTLTWPAGTSNGNAHKRTILQGAGKSFTTIRLANHAPGFATPKIDNKYKRPMGKGMIWTGNAPAQRFRNAVRDLTLNTGKGNPVACGLQFMANNQGCVRNVIIRSEDNKGLIGLDLGYAHEQGPCLIKNVTIIGFDYGIYAFGHVNSITMMNIHIENQNKSGILNNNQILSIENLVSIQPQKVPSLINTSGDGVVTLIHAKVDTPIQNAKGTLYARMADGTQLINGGKATLPKDGGTPQALHLPIRPTPEIPFDPLDQWVSPLEFGGQQGDTSDDTDAIQKAIDSGRTTLYLPCGKWIIDGDLYLRRNIHRVIGCEGTIKGKGKIHIVDGTAPVVIFERIEIQYSPISILHESTRTLVISSCRLQRDHSYPACGGGDVFIEDVSGDPFVFKNQNVWARQLNPEHPKTKITQYGGKLWILGLKTESHGTALEMFGGQAEIAGGFIYANTRVEKQPLIVLHDNAQFSATLGESSYRGFPFKTLVKQDTPIGIQTLKQSDVPRRTGGSKFALISTKIED